MVNGAADAAVGLVAFSGDIDFDGAYTSTDVTLLGRIGTGALTSVAQLPRVDLTVLADVDASGVVNAADTAQVLARSRAMSTPMIAASPAPAPAPTPASMAMAAAPAPAGSSSSSSSTAPASTPAAAPTINLAGSFSNFSIAPEASLSVLPNAGIQVLPSTAPKA